MCERSYFKKATWFFYPRTQYIYICIYFIYYLENGLVYQLRMGTVREAEDEKRGWRQRRDNLGKSNDLSGRQINWAARRLQELAAICWTVAERERWEGGREEHVILCFPISLRRPLGPSLTRFLRAEVCEASWPFLPPDSLRTPARRASFGEDWRGGDSWSRAEQGGCWSAGLTAWCGDHGYLNCSRAFVGLDIGRCCLRNWPAIQAFHIGIEWKWRWLRGSNSVRWNALLTFSRECVFSSVWRNRHCTLVSSICFTKSPGKILTTASRQFMFIEFSTYQC